MRLVAELFAEQPLDGERVRSARQSDVDGVPTTPGATAVELLLLAPTAYVNSSRLAERSVALTLRNYRRRGAFCRRFRSEVCLLLSTRLFL